MPGIFVDGTDVLKVYAAAHEAIERARTGDGPTLIEALTLRVHGHSAADNAEYVPRATRDEWKRKDPLVRFETYLRAEHVLDDAIQQEITRRITGEVDAAVEQAEAMPLPEPETALSGVWA